MLLELAMTAALTTPGMHTEPTALYCYTQQGATEWVWINAGMPYAASDAEASTVCAPALHPQTSAPIVRLYEDGSAVYLDNGTYLVPGSLAEQD